MTVTCTPNSEVYTGTALTPCTATVTGAGGLSLSVPSTSLIYTNNINVGTAEATYNFAGDANHAGTTGSGNFQITQASPTVTVTCNPTSVVYTGAAQTPCTATVTGAGGLNQSVPVTYLNNIDAGTATANATYASTTDYSTASGSATFQITHASPTVTVTCPVSVVYDGAALTPCTATVTDAVTGLNQSVPVTYTNNTNAGTATANATYTATTDYATASGSATFAINPAPVTATGGSFSGFYDGNTHSPSACVVTGTYTGGLTCTDTPSSVGPGAGTGTVVPTYTSDPNFAITAVNGTWTIALASTTVTLTCPASVDYTGSPLTPCTASVTIPGGQNQSLTVTYVNNTNVGTARATATYPGDVNHALAPPRSLQHRAGNGGADSDNGDLPGERYLYRRGADTVLGDSNGRGRGRTEPVADCDLHEQHQSGHGGGQRQLRRECHL